MNLETDNFILYADAEVFYDGRASSTLKRGNYLIIKKQDGSLMIHGANHIQALNYIGNRSTIKIKSDDSTGCTTITATKRSETIRIEVYKIHNILALPDWSAHKIKISKTEAELVTKIIDNPEKYLGPGSYLAYKEFITEAGPIDILLTSDIATYAVEVKRKKITLKDCYQIRRYLDAFDNGYFRGNVVIGCLAGPDISTNALKHSRNSGIKYLQVLFDE